MKRLLPVACALLWNDKKLFVAKRRKDQFPPDLWELPGGKIEPKELPIHTITRELYEELSMSVEALEVYEHSDYEYEKFIVRLFPVLCTTSSTSYTLHEHADGGWFTPDECMGLEWAPADLPILTEHVFKRS